MSINLHLYPSPIEFESRIMRVTASLAASERFEAIHIVGLHREGLAVRERLDARRQVWRVPVAAPPLPGPGRRAGELVAWMAAIYRAYRQAPLACINPHSLTVLPLAVALARATGAALVYDTHELETETAASGRLRRVVARAVERACMPHVDATVVVSDSIAAWYARRYPGTPVHTIKNYPVARAAAAPGGLRAALGLGDDALVFLYQGLLSGGRGLDLLLDAFPDRPDRHLVFMGYGPLAARIQAAAAERANVHYHPAVPPGDVLRYTAEADVGLSLIEPVSLSYRYCLPNKLLEYLSCGVPPLVSALPDMVREIEDGRLGWAVPLDPEAVRSLLTAITRDEARRRATRLDGWAATHSWAAMEERLAHLYDTLPLPAQPPATPAVLLPSSATPTP